MQTRFDTDFTRWMAVSRRNRDAEGRFFYAVKTTGIYCRPDCPSRPPKRENVEFFATAGEAQKAGYRPCKRCRPDVLHPRMEVIKHACRYIQAHLDEQLTLGALAKEVNLSPFHFQRLFKNTLGVSPREYQEEQRMKCFKSSLKNGERIAHALYGAGFGSSSRLYEKASAQMGMKPAAYRKKGAGVRIGFTVFDCVLGKALIAATPGGLCSVAFGDSEVRLEADLRTEYSKATIEHDATGLRNFIKPLTGYLNGNRQNINLPLDIQATAFQRRVWKVLRKIPYGQTRSYSEIAKTLGEPHSVRAVAHACAKNPVAVVIPCHRVVRKNGKLADYRWGVQRKALLLANEKGR
jgi:AraC family transcriptional regulator of adaptative response/methylated-DNA-[protein]-cysteine methyltransferase